jgi:5'(3')-deoxyribonucleotidase
MVTARSNVACMANDARFVLGVDLDGVCAAFYEGLRPLAEEWLNVELDSLSQQFTFGLREWGFENIEQYRRFHRWAVTERDLFKNLDPLPNAPVVLRRLSERGIHIRIITHRLFIAHLHRLGAQQTIEWLDYHGIPYRDLCLVADKTAVGADLYVEDTPSNITALRTAGLHTIVFSNPTNLEEASPRADTWEEVEVLVLDQTQPWWADYRQRSKSVSGR